MLKVISTNKVVKKFNTGITYDTVEIHNGLQHLHY